MDRGAWWATGHGVTQVGHDLVTKLPLEAPKRKKKKTKPSWDLTSL